MQYFGKARKDEVQENEKVVRIPDKVSGRSA